MVGLFLSGLSHINPIVDRTNNPITPGPPSCSLGLHGILDRQEAPSEQEEQGKTCR